MSAESLESLLARLEAAAGVTPVTPPAEGGVTRKPASTLTCTPVTPVTPPADDFEAQRAANDAPDPEALREAFEERAGILEFDACLPRAEAEARAWVMVYGGPTPAQRAEAEQLAELARRPRGGGGLGWRDHDVVEYLSDDLQRQPAWALAALRECLAHEAAALAGHPDASALYTHLMQQPGRSASLRDIAHADGALQALARAGLVRIEGERVTAQVPELATLGRRRSADARPRTYQR
jgi:hypothetical protein